MNPPDLACYLRREDGEWYELGYVRYWRLSFGVFPGPADGSVQLTPKDTNLLALRLYEHEYDHDLRTRERIAADIIRWGNGMRMRFMSELEIDPDDKEIGPDSKPTLITGSALSLRGH